MTDARALFWLEGQTARFPADSFPLEFTDVVHDVRLSYVGPDADETEDDTGTTRFNGNIVDDGAGGSQIGPETVGRYDVHACLEVRAIGAGGRNFRVRTSLWDNSATDFVSYPATQHRVIQPYTAIYHRASEVEIGEVADYIVVDLEGIGHGGGSVTVQARGYVMLEYRGA